MTHPSTIALIAPAMGSGKSTIAHYLSERYDYEIVPFAKPMRLMVKVLLESFGIGPQEVNYLLTAGKEMPILDIPGQPTVRKLMQTLGTEWGRNRVHEKLWIYSWLALADRHPRVVSDDCRFLNEYWVVKSSHAAAVWRVICPSAVITTAHASEGQLDNVEVDAEIINDGTLAELYAKVDALMESLK